MLKKVSLSILSLTLFSTSTMADAPRQSPWNYNSASNYALQWALARNPNYISFTNDCTNFVSQALRTGGWKDTTTLVSTQMHSWFYKSGTNYAQTWSTANGLRNRIANGYELGTTKLGKSFAGLGPEYLNNQIRVGDIILADWDDNGIYDHAMMVTSVSFSTTLVSYHSNDRKNYSMADVSAASPNAKFEVYHVT
ncbi:amidase domain-containing protein [Acinetobacter guillouiae]|uniref:amidase domain-containing protein n=1 Tax=Acinetobacter guillouiae TaxID=106649 RepID=UPI003AF73712